MEKRALTDLLELLAIPGPSDAEGPVRDYITRFCANLPGFRGRVQTDPAGNLIVRFDGTGARRLFSAHLDTIPLAVGAVPEVKDGFVVNRKPGTSLGGDCRAGCAILLQLIRRVNERSGSFPPSTFAFFVQEENGEWGSRKVDVEMLGAPAMAFNFDGEDPAVICHASTGVERFHIDVRGRSAHAGINPEEGISAALILSVALSRLASEGWFGRIRRAEGSGTANLGVLQGGKISNAVMPDLYAYGEARSPDPEFRGRIVAAWKEAFRRAAAGLANARGERGETSFRPGPVSEAYHLEETSPVVRAAAAAIRGSGLTPVLEVADGVGDPNWLNAKGIPCVGLGMGVHACHAADERVYLKEFNDSCRIALALSENS